MTRARERARGGSLPRRAFRLVHAAQMAEFGFEGGEALFGLVAAALLLLALLFGLVAALFGLVAAALLLPQQPLRVVVRPLGCALPVVDAEQQPVRHQREA